jgi:hypothetical protein
MLYPTKCATLPSSATPASLGGTTHKALERCHDRPQKKKKKNTTHCEWLAPPQSFLERPNGRYRAHFEVGH